MSEELCCPACGACFGAAPRCQRCHEGLRYAGRPFRSTRSSRHCPRCGAKAALHTITFRDVQIDVCEACEGAWFDVGELEHVIGGIRTAVREGRWQAEAVPERGRSHSAAGPQGYVPCPVCGNLMHRVNWEKTSGIVVDVCRSHGVWLDGGEVAALQGWAAQTPDGPPTTATELKPRRDPSEVAAVLSRQPRPRRPEPGPARQFAGLLYDLFDIASDFFD